MNKFVLSSVCFLLGVALGIFLENVILQPGTAIIPVEEELGSDAEFELFTVYGADKGANGLEENFIIKIQKRFSLLEKLQVIADRLSRFKFNYLPIQVLKVEDEAGRKIAAINLEENDWNKGSNQQLRSGNAGVTWRSNFFQGTTGGWYTSQTLIQSFLQNDYKGNWIDGVKFLYEGEPIGDWDHIQLKHMVHRTISE